MGKHGVVIQKVSCSFVVKCRKYLAENFTYDEDSGEAWCIMKTSRGSYHITDDKAWCFEVTKFGERDGVLFSETIYRYNYV